MRSTNKIPTPPPTPIDPMDVSEENLNFLYNLQGNILKGHGRDHTTHIFVSFTADAKDVREWIKTFTNEYVTCFQQQLKERELFKRNGTPGGLFASIFLTKAGYKHLGFTDVENRLKDEGFRAGMKARLDTNNDPNSSDWEAGFRDDIHAMILLADNDLKRMGETATGLLNEEPDVKFSKKLHEISTIRSIEYGHVIRNANGDGIEHFGYVDGVSQPLFLKDEVDDYMKFHNIKLNDEVSEKGNELEFDPRADKNLVLISDPYAPGTSKDKSTSFGSYFVFRKLEQNVKKFKDKEGEIGHNLYGDKHELLGALLVGRSEDGTPVVITDTEGLIGSGNFNNFNYAKNDSEGRCPYFAHIRKTNPREDILPPDQDSGGEPVEPKRRIMARRGIPYGHRAINTALGLDPSPHQMPENGVGLLFMSYQASIKDQFEAIQKNWANDAEFPKTTTGVDPIIGQVKSHDTYGTPVPTNDLEQLQSYYFPQPYGTSTQPVGSQSLKIKQTTPVPDHFGQFVTMKGGEYFFAPSMSFLKNIDDPYLTKESSEITLQSELAG